MVGENYEKENREDINYKTNVLFALKIRVHEVHELRWYSGNSPLDLWTFYF